MDNLKNAKKRYDNIEIPNELSEITNKAIKQKRPNKIVKYIYSTAAGLLLFLITGLNVSETFAINFSKIPIIGNLVYIVSRYSEEVEENKTITTRVPEILIQNDSQNNEIKNNNIDKVNTEIDRLVNEFTVNASKRFDEYKQAFLETGGTEEEFNERKIDINVSYDIKSKSDNHLSLKLEAYESWISFYAESYFYNIDLNTGEDITLEDLLGKDYIKIANESIEKQINEQVKNNPEVSYFGYGENSDETYESKFTTITNETKFYINEKGNPVVVFDKYSIAPGYMGEVEFEII